MRSVRKTGPGLGDVDLVLHEPAPLPVSGHVRVRVGAAGICGTDLHILDGTYSSRPPVTLGHEVAGFVDELSSDVDPGWLGAAVAVETFYRTCTTCRYCRAGRPNLCADRLSIGSGVDGGFADSVVVPVRNLHLLPVGTAVEAGALSEPLACVCQSLRTTSTAVGLADRVLIIGPGAVGLIAAQVARTAGAEVLVTGTERDAHRLALARELGLATATAPLARADLPHGWDDGPDVVVECSGSQSGMAMGLTIVRKAGRYVQMGQTGSPVSVPLAEVSFKELTVTGGFASTPASWRSAMDLLRAGGIRLEPLVSTVFALENWSAAFRATESGEGVKNLLSPQAV